MREITILIVLLLHLNLFSQRKIYQFGNASGVIYNSKDFSAFSTAKEAQEFEGVFQKKYPLEFNDYVRQYTLKKIDGENLLFAVLIPIENAYEYKWRCERYHGRSRKVRIVFYDIDKKYLSEVSWVNIDE